MKQCPNCRKTYGDDLFFCLDDGSPLSPVHTVDPNARTEAAYDVASSLRTEVIPSAPAPKTKHIQLPVATAQPRASRLPYVIIALLVFVCLALAAILIGLNLDRLLPKKETANIAVNNGPTPAPLPSPSSSTNKIANIAPAANVRPENPIDTYDPKGRWKGEWSTASGTLFDFELTLNQTGPNGLNGQIKWTMRRSARPDKQHMIGFSAIEYVTGSFDPATGTVNLTGRSKDDPDGMLVMLDVYKLTISPDGQKLTGLARNGGKWNGKVNLRR